MAAASASAGVQAAVDARHRMPCRCKLLERADGPRFRSPEMLPGDPVERLELHIRSLAHGYVEQLAMPSAPPRPQQAFPDEPAEEGADSIDGGRGIRDGGMDLP